MNADYYGRRGVVIIKKQNSITLSNPESSRIELDTAVSGGVSDPRNSTMLKMFNFIDIGERAGSGIPNIFRVWKEQGWQEPLITECYEPDRVTLTLNLSAEKFGDKKSAISQRVKENIISYLTEHPDGKTSHIAEFIELKESRTRDYLKELTEEGIIEMSGSNKNRVYRLKR